MIKIIPVLVIFSIILNLATGAVAKLPVFEDYMTNNIGGLSYDANYNEGWEDAVGGSNNSVTPGTEEVAGVTPQNSVFDFLGIKAITRMITVIDNFMFGFVNLLSAMFRGALDSAGTGLGTWIFNGFKGLIGFAYIAYFFYLFTGRKFEVETK